MGERIVVNWVTRHLVGINVGMVILWLFFATTQFLLFLGDEGDSAAPIFGIICGLGAASCFAAMAVLHRHAQKKERARQSDQ
jgi:drug/metabolite transporter (DMT)-like permease